MDADDTSAYIADTTQIGEETVYIEIKTLGAFETFTLDAVDVGEYTDGIYNNVHVVGSLRNSEVFSSTAYDNGQSGTTAHFNLDLSAASGKTIDSFRIYYTKGAGLDFAHSDFGVYSFTFSNPAANAAPTATVQATTGTHAPGQTLTGHYTYSDAESDPEGASAYQWYRADNLSGDNKQAIAGATAITYVLQADDTGRYISFEVTPVAATGTASGAAAASAWSGKVWFLIAVHPSNTQVLSGEDASLTVQAVGRGLSYQWQVDHGTGYSDLVEDATYSQVTSDTLTIHSATPSLFGLSYRVNVTATGCGTLPSEPATLRVMTPPPHPL